MTVKQIIEVDVEDAKFQRYKELFDKYDAALKKQPAAWRELNKSIAGGTAAHQRMSAAVAAQARMHKEVGDMQRAQNRSLQVAERAWGSIAKHTSNVASSLFNATRHLLSWGTLAGIGGGLLGLGGLFGIERLAGTASNERRASMGLGMSIGQRRAFQINFERLVDPDAYLGWVNQMETDPTKAWSAAALGVGMSGNTQKDAVSMLRAVRSRAQATPMGLLGMLPQQYGLQGMSTEDLRRLKTMSGAEFEQLLAGNAKDAGRTNISDEVAKKWQDLITTLQEAKSTIFATLVKGLVPLAGPLGHLSQAAVKFTETMLKSDLVSNAIKGLAHWLETFSGTISEPKFLGNIRRLMDEFGDLADIIHVIAHPLDSLDSGITGGVVGAINSRQNFLDNPTKEGYLKMLARTEERMGLPKGILAYQWQKESGSTWMPKDSPKGAVGPFGLMPDTAKWLSDTYGTPIDPRDPMRSALGAAEYDKFLSKKYNGDVEKILAAYNMGQNKLDPVLAAHPKDWQRFVPRETQGYISRQGNLNITVNVNAPPGHAVDVVTSQQVH